MCFFCQLRSDRWANRSMDSYFVILACLLLVQISLIFALLNPNCDVQKMTQFFNDMIRRQRAYYFLSIIVYFGVVTYFGIYAPLMNVFKLIFSNENDEYKCQNKAVILGNVEKIYMMAGFSLFLFLVTHGVRALISYAAHLLELACSIPERRIREGSHDCWIENIDILPYLLRMKRPIAQNTITWNKDELGELQVNVEQQYKNWLNMLKWLNKFRDSVLFIF